MRFTPAPLKGAFIIDLQRHEDERGFFGRAFCEREFQGHGLSTPMVQTNVSFSKEKGTLRGMHYQAPPHEEAKLIRCTRGSIYDVIVDVRPDSSSFLEWMGVELSSENGRMLYVPEGFAHGFLTLEESAEVAYQVSEFYTPGSERGIRYDDPEIGIDWPGEVRVLSDKDRTWPAFERSDAVEQ
jgi:dTDP-4-dehydrorhamnose 3,5-epimerase